MSLTSRPSPRDLGLTCAVLVPTTVECETGNRGTTCGRGRRPPTNGPLGPPLWVPPPTRGPRVNDLLTYLREVFCFEVFEGGRWKDEEIVNGFYFLLSLMRGLTDRAPLSTIPQGLDHTTDCLRGTSRVGP